MGGHITSPTTRRAALAVAVIVCTAGLALAQTAAPPQPAASKPAAKPAAPKPAAKPAAAAKPPPAASGPTACVASTIGHVFEVQKVGLMVFGNALDRVTVSSWGIDDAAISRVQALTAGKYAVRRIPVSAAAIEEAMAGAPIWAPAKPGIPDVLRTAAGGGRCDITVAFTRSVAGFNGTNQKIIGLGIVQQGAGFFERAYVHAIFDIRLYDADLKVLRTERVSEKPLLAAGLGLMGPAIYGMFKSVEPSQFPAPPQAAVQNATLKAAARDLVSDGIGRFLPIMLQQQ